MHPLLLHQIADDHVLHRRRSHPHHCELARRRRRQARNRSVRARAVLGGVLITLGTRLAGPRPAAGALHRTPT